MEVHGGFAPEGRKEESIKERDVRQCAYGGPATSYVTHHTCWFLDVNS